MKRTSFAVMMLCALLSSNAGAKDKAKADVIWHADAIKWEAGPVAGSKVAKLWGDSAKGAYGMLVKFDAGLNNPMHHHTHTLRLIVISGLLMHKAADGSENKLGPGSYLLQLGGNKHISGCAAGAECQFLLTSDAKFDFINEKK